MADEIWTAKECGAHLKCSPKHFLRKIRFKDGFPDRLPWSDELRPRWASEEVRAWALRRDYANAA